MRNCFGLSHDVEKTMEQQSEKTRHSRAQAKEL